MNKRKRGQRCLGCHLRPELCVCAQLPELTLTTPITVIRHYKERHKPTNTATLLKTMVPAVSIVEYRPDPESLQAIDAALVLRDDWSVLFPRQDARVLASARSKSASPSPGAFVVLDGTWHQCSRMSRRLPGVRELPCVALPEDGPPSIYRLRTQHDERGLSTFEAVLRLWELLEGEDEVRPLRAAFELIVARMLYQKGWLARPEVPESWDDVRPA